MKTLSMVVIYAALSSVCAVPATAQHGTENLRLAASDGPALKPAQSESSQADAHAEARVDGREEGRHEDQAEEELQKGTALTRKGEFREAIPHLLAAQGKVANAYAAGFNLALCYVGTGEYAKAIQMLKDLHPQGSEDVAVKNLLAQAYVGNGQPEEALSALQAAAALAPRDEKLYLFVSDACMQRQDFPLGLKVIDLGLRNLPQSARLHYERAVFLSQMDQLDQSKSDFAEAARFGQGTEIAALAAAHAALLEGDIDQAVKVAREAVSKGAQDPGLLTILGEAVIRSGASPGDPQFAEAQSALEKAVTERPHDAASQIALGQLYLMGGRLDDAIAHLEKAREMRPNQPSVYAALAKAYQRRGDLPHAQQALATLEKLNRAREEQIRSAPGDRRMSYSGAGNSAERRQP